MHATLPLLNRAAFRRCAAGDDHAAGEPRLSLQPELRALPRQRRPQPEEMMDADTLALIPQVLAAL